MKRWFLAGAVAVLAGGWALIEAQTPPADEPQGDVLMEVALAEDMEDMVFVAATPAEDVWMGEEEDVLMELAAADGPSEAYHFAPDHGGTAGTHHSHGRTAAHHHAPLHGRPMGMMGGRMMGGPMMLARVQKALGLTDEQVKKLHDLRMAHQKDIIRTGADARIARLELADALRQPNPKPEDVSPKLEAVNAARSQMLRKQVMFRMEMKKVFTPEQQEKMRDMMMQRMGGGWGRGGGGWGWGGGQQWRPKEEPKGEPKK